MGELERVLSLGNTDLEGCMLGINNRDLQTFKVDLANTKDIMHSTAGRQVRCYANHWGCSKELGPVQGCGWPHHCRPQ